LAASIASVAQARRTAGCLDFVVAAALWILPGSTSTNDGTRKLHSPHSGAMDLART